MIRAVLLAVIASTTLSLAQTAPAPLAFEVASIKRNTSGDTFADGGFQPGGRISAKNVTLVNLLIAAYALPSDRIDGGPAWSKTDRFDVVAVGSARNYSVAETREMLKTLLADRFKLTTRMEARDRPIFAMTRISPDRLGPQLRVSTPDCAGERRSTETLPPSGPPSLQNPACGTIAFGGSVLRGHGVRVAQIAGMVSQFVDRFVRDEAALDGLYDFELKWSRPSENPNPTDPPEMFSAIREQLGLQLDSRRGPVDVLVITGAEQPAVDN